MEQESGYNGNLESNGVYILGIQRINNLKVLFVESV
jgi:hypothetical protein